MLENFLTYTAKSKKSFDKITAISFEANEFKKNHPDKPIINGTIGMYLDENESQYLFPVIEDLSSSFILKDISAYGALYPTINFSEGVLNLLNLNGEYRKDCIVFPTAGGLNALHHFVHNFIDTNTSIFSFSPYWGPYENVIEELGFKIEKIEFKKYKDFKIDRQLIFNSINKTVKDKIIFIINLPCQNPTGLTPDFHEINEIKDSILNLQKKGKQILIFFDLVYIHYSNLYINDLFEIFSDLPFIFNFSSSKTLSLYGFRTGAICLYSKLKEDQELFKEKIAFSARASTGSINNFGYKLIEKFADKSLVERLKPSWEEVKKNLKLRSDRFIKILQRFNLGFFRYDEGFFISFFSKRHDIKTFYRLLKDNGIFFVPQTDSIRVAISSIPLSKFDELEKRFENLI